MSFVQLYRNKDLNHLHFSNSEQEAFEKSFFLSFMRNTPSYYISNVNTEMCCLRIDEWHLPVTVNHKEYENSYVASPYGVVMYSQEELKRFDQSRLAPFLLPVLKWAGKIFKNGNINRVVTVNNWLFSTNLYPPLSKNQILSSVELLQAQFPDHAILWKSLNINCPENLLSIFENLSCKKAFCRQVYFFDPSHEAKLSQKQRWNIKADGKLIKSKGYEILPGAEIQDEDIPHLRKLYDLLYLDKHNPLNPQFTDSFMHLAIRNKLLNTFALYKENRIDGFMSYLVKGNTMTVPLVGYNTHLPQEIGLYRMLTSLCIEEARRLNLKLNHSGGAAHFKRVRGMHAVSEYMAIFDQHLPLQRRLVWNGFAALLNNIGKPFFIHYKL